MKLILAISLLLAANSAMANAVIKNPTSRDCLQMALYKEARGESLVTMRAVADVVLNRARKNNVTICETILERGQFPYAKKGIKKITDKQFLTKYFKVLTMKPVVSQDVIYFNHRKHKWAGSHRKIGNLYFSKEKK